MSHQATHWAIRQRGLTPAAKLVLMHLADRHNPDHGCFPTQARLAEDCEMSRSTLNRHLLNLEKQGLIRRDQRRDTENNRQLPTLYQFAFEDGFQPVDNAEKPCPKSGHGTSPEQNEEMAENSEKSRVPNPDTEIGEPCPNPAPSRVPTVGHITCKGTGKEEREARASADDEPEKGKTDDRFDRIVKLWPTAKVSNLDQSRRLFDALADDDRQRALDAVPAMLGEYQRAGQKHAHRLETYLRDRKFTLFSDDDIRHAANGAEKSDVMRYHAAFSERWWAVYWRRLKDRDRRAAAMAHRGSSQAAGISEKSTEPLPSVEVTQVAVTSVDWQDWRAQGRAYCRELKLGGFPEPAKAEWVFVPVDGFAAWDIPALAMADDDGEDAVWI